VWRTWDTYGGEGAWGGWWRNFKEKGTLEKPRRTWENVIKMGVQAVGWWPWIG